MELKPGGGIRRSGGRFVFPVDHIKHTAEDKDDQQGGNGSFKERTLFARTAAGGIFFRNEPQDLCF